MLQLADNPARPSLCQQAGHLLFLGIGIHGLHKKGHHVGDIPIGNKPLGSIYYVVIPIPYCRRLQARHIRTGVGFGESVGGQGLATGQVGQKPLFLFFGSGNRDCHRAKALAGQYHANRATCLGYFLTGDGHGKGLAAGPAIFRRKRNGQYPVFRKGFLDIPGIATDFIEFPGPWRYLLPHHLLHVFPKCQ
ncbi:MAG: hypothetical protein A4E72_01713 [Syntrophus sp. PtaU1.Bin208]|nr:MAG: hypothetical protein A4E72_01713 [Syntrophus sp. PtaU1.Bin208]